MTDTKLNSEDVDLIIKMIGLSSEKLLERLLGLGVNVASSPHIGAQCIVRTYASGVFFGTVLSIDGRMVTMQNARRLWRWKAVQGISLSAVAVSGIEYSQSKVSQAVEFTTLLDAIEILALNENIKNNIASAPIAQQE